MTISSDQITNRNSNTNAVYAANSQVGTTTLTGDDFLRLMMVQLQNQDPTDPMDTDQFLQQQAMFTQVTTMQEINENFTNYSEMVQACSYIGQEVTVKDNNDNEITGTVTAAQTDSDGASIVIDDVTYPIDNIVSVAKNPETVIVSTATDESESSD